MRAIGLAVLQRLMLAALVVMFTACSVQTRPDSQSSDPFGADATRRPITSADGTILGASERSSKTLPDGRTLLRTRKTLRIKEDDAPRRRVIEETTALYATDGVLVSIDKSYSAGSGRARTFALTEKYPAGRAIRVTRSIPGDSREVLLDLPADIAFDQGASLFKAALQTEQTGAVNGVPVELDFHVLDLDAPAIRQVSVRELKSTGADTRLFERRLYSQRFAKRVLQSVTLMSFNAQARTSNTLQTTFGGGVKVDAHEDQDRGFKAASLVSEVLVKSPVRIPAAARKGRIRYRFESKLDDVRAFVIPVTGEQKVSVSDSAYVVDVCSRCGVGLPTDAPFLEAALQPTFWLQSDHEEFQKIVLSVTASVGRQQNKSSVERRVMRRLRSAAARRIKQTNFAGHLSALEAWRRRSGDCTESAVILTALARAAGIPAMVASGVVYSRERYHGVSHVFMPHAWTLAYIDGAWRSYDSALPVQQDIRVDSGSRGRTIDGDSGFDATHVAFAISDGDPASIGAGHRLAGLVEMTELVEVRKRPAGESR